MTANLEQRLGRLQPRTLDKENSVNRAGKLSDFLTDQFLAGFISDKEERQKIVDSVIQLTSPLFDKSNSTKVRLTGSVPKCLARGMPQHFYDYAETMKIINARIADLTDNQQMRDVINSSPADMDIKVLLRDGIQFMNLASDIASIYSLGSEVIKNSQGKINNRIALSFKFGDLAVKIDAGVIPTNPRLQNMTIHIQDGEERDLFHVDVGMLPRDAQSAHRDKRTGLTSDKQDLCTAELTRTNDGQIWYLLGDEAISVMNKQDQIVTESEDPWFVWEIALRALRHNVLHQFVFDKELTIPLSELFLPHFTSKSLFDLRRRAHQLIETVTPCEDNVKKILQKELALCLSIDPFVTVQFLRDSAVSDFIPGIRNLTREQWNQLLRSKYFSLDLVTDTRAATTDERDVLYIQSQHNLYVSGNLEFNGLWRFMMALQEMGVAQVSNDNYLDAYLNIWENGRIKKEISIDRIQQIVGNTIKPRTDRDRIELNDEQLLRMALIYGILENHKSGVTARELEEIYQKHASDDTTIFFGSYSFELLLLDLKLLGLVGKNSINRIDKLENIVPADFYYPILKQNDLRARIGGGRDKINLRLSKALAITYRYGISSVEALSSLTEHDYHLLIRRGELNKSDFTKALSEVKDALIGDTVY